jgi:hypothetical protein
MMIKPKTNVQPEQVRQGARHVIFVEGNDDNSIDPFIINTLFDNNAIFVDVKPLGASFYIRSAAQALHPHHPEYYFIIDRDHCFNEEVESTWSNFPDETKNNLLIWRKREIENYFLSIDYLMKSSYINCERQKIEQCLLRIARERVFFEAANIVIIGCREEFKKKWIKNFDKVNDFKTKEDAITKLTTKIPEFLQRKQDLCQYTDIQNLEGKLNTILAKFYGGRENLEIGCGNWIDLMGGKQLLATVVNECFRVEDRNGKRITGKDATNAVVKDLLRRPLYEQPNDFQQLCELVKKRVNIK